MPTKTFTSGRIRKADYDPASQQLDLHWDNKNVLAYKHVPQEVYRRLCSAPNPATYWEDRIADEYPKGVPMKPGAAAGETAQHGNLFGDVAPSSARTVGEIETFVNLLSLACEDAKVSAVLQRLLAMPDAQRQSMVLTWVSDLIVQGAPQDFVQAIACLQDDAVAAKTREVLFPTKR